MSFNIDDYDYYPDGDFSREDAFYEEWVAEMEAEQSGLPGAPAKEDIANTDELPF